MDNDFRYGLGWFSDYYLAKKHGVSRAVVQGVRRNHGIEANPEALGNDRAEPYDARMFDMIFSEWKAHGERNHAEQHDGQSILSRDFSKYLRAIPEEIIAETFGVPVSFVTKARVYSGIPAWHKNDKEVAIRLFKGIQNEHRSD